MVAADAAAVSAVVRAAESSLYGASAFSQADVEEEWAALDLERDARVVSDGDRVVGYGLVRERDELWRVEAYVHPDALGHGIGTLLATALEEDAAVGGAVRIQNAVLERDSAAARAAGVARLHRRARLPRAADRARGAAPATRVAGRVRVAAFDPERDAREFHAAHQEAFADFWDFTPRDFAAWSKTHIASERFDPALWCVVRAGDEIAAGTICVGDTYGGGWVDVLFTRRPWRRQGVGAALLAERSRASGSVASAASG